jgi:hypothetical protein
MSQTKRKVRGKNKKTQRQRQRQTEKIRHLKRKRDLKRDLKIRKFSRKVGGRFPRLPKLPKIPKFPKFFRSNEERHKEAEENYKKIYEQEERNSREKSRQPSPSRDLLAPITEEEEAGQEDIPNSNVSRTNIDALSQFKTNIGKMRLQDSFPLPTIIRENPPEDPHPQQENLPEESQSRKTKLRPYSRRNFSRRAIQNPGSRIGQDTRPHLGDRSKTMTAEIIKKSRSSQANKSK